MNSLITKNNANPIAINDDNGVMEDIVSIVCNGSPKLGVNFSKSLSVFESANKINKTLQDLIDILGNREMAICREMTKKFEEIITGKISDIAQKIVSKKLKGEIVIVLYGDNKKDQEINLDEIINSFEGEYRPSELAKIISDQTGFSKSIIYNKIIRLKEDH